MTWKQTFLMTAIKVHAKYCKKKKNMKEEAINSLKEWDT